MTWAFTAASTPTVAGTNRASRACRVSGACGLVCILVRERDVIRERDGIAGFLKDDWLWAMLWANAMGEALGGSALSNARYSYRRDVDRIMEKVARPANRVN